MILNEIELYNFMIFNGKHSFNFSNNVNLIVGKNESGKSVLSIDSFKYVFLKRIRYKKIENVLNNRADKDDHGFVSIVSSVEDIDMTFKRYLQHTKYKNNLCIVSDNTPVFINDKDSFANVKNVPIQQFLKNLNVDMDHFDLISVYNPTKDILVEKKSILDLLSVNFNSVISMFDTIYRTFDSEVSFIQNDVNGLEEQLIQLTKSSVVHNEIDKIKDENIRIASKIKEFKENKEKLTDAVAKLNGHSGELKTKVSTNRSRMEKLLTFYKSGTCQMCGRPFDDEVQRSKLKKEIELKRDEILDAEGKLNKLTARITQIRETVKKLEDNMWILADRSKNNEKKMVNNDAKIDTLRTMAQQKRKALEEIEDRVLGFKRRYEAVFSQEEINNYIKQKINSFEKVYQEIYNIITQQNTDIKLNLNKYEEPEFGDFFYSGLCTSKRRITYLVMMLTLHVFCDTKLNFLILDEFFDVFDFENMVKILETIFSTTYFKDLQFIITSNNDDLIGLIKDNKINLINLIDYTKN